MLRNEFFLSMRALCLLKRTGMRYFEGIKSMDSSKSKNKTKSKKRLRQSKKLFNCPEEISVDSYSPSTPVCFNVFFHSNLKNSLISN